MKCIVEAPDLRVEVVQSYPDIDGMDKQFFLQHSELVKVLMKFQEHQVIRVVTPWSAYVKHSFEILLKELFSYVHTNNGGQNQDFFSSIHHLDKLAIQYIEGNKSRYDETMTNKWLVQSKPGLLTMVPKARRRIGFVAENVFTPFRLGIKDQKVSDSDSDIY